MAGTYAVTMGDRGRLVVPRELRERGGLDPGDVLVLIESPTGVAMISRDRLRDLVQQAPSDRDLVAELLADRRHEAAGDAAT